MSQLDLAKSNYEAQLDNVNSLRNQMYSLMHEYQRACYALVKKRARYISLAKKAGETLPRETWWEKGPE
jgi:hypothetical protein